ncbi:N-acetylgalactosamine-6-sulfatase-like [Panulirus ornatus]|uniref:N-acetylgalactosamine-6-sulfatase-like n=1 Tax=Panulirus ornatus TaxID=150431 RepID=UPI003A87FA4E
MKNRSVVSVSVMYSVRGKCNWLLAIGLLLFTPAAATDDLPNVIIMLMDDMGWGDLGWNGEPSRETPNIDQLASEGLTVTSMYTAAPLCSPSRASLLTGRLPIRNGFYSNNTAGRNVYNFLSPHYPPLYITELSPPYPSPEPLPLHTRYYEDFSINRVRGLSNMTQLFTQEAIGFIEREAGRGPFFLLWAPDSTHAPTYASDAFRGTSRRGRYGDAVRELDAGVGAIIEALRHAGVDNNTLVVFTSDNGAALVSKQEGGSNGPFLCGKQTTYEGGMRVPGVFWWPGVIPAGSVSQQVWTQMDLFSTVAQLAGVPLPQGRQIDGLPLANSLIHPHLEIFRPVFLYRGNRLMAVRQGSYKMHLWTWSTPTYELAKGIDYCPGADVHNVTTSTPTDHSDRPVLFNIAVDPGERYPISSHSAEYSSQVPVLLQAVFDHRAKLKRGEPQLNWCDRAVMHWAPPGCEALGKCLKPPASNPTLCNWPH